jgi:UDP-N-acetylmuramate dehydrogenase
MHWPGIPLLGCSSPFSNAYGGLFVSQDSDIHARLNHIAGILVQSDYPMSHECSFRLGGKAKYFCVPQDTEALHACLRVCRQAGVPYIVIGGGTNLLFRDEGYWGVVLSTKKLDRVSSPAQNRVHVGAGLNNARLSEYTFVHALTGFEWAAGLPGTVGGGIFMNAKCYGSSFAEIVIEVCALSPEGDWVTLSASECDFRYKHSIFQQNGYLITDAWLALKPGNAKTIQAQHVKNLRDRKKRGQFSLPSAGCVYKNDYTAGASAGALIESCGLKGHQIGGVRVFEQHANFLVNVGNGRTQDVMDLMHLIETKVWEKHHVRLEPEIRIVP